MKIPPYGSSSLLPFFFSTAATDAVVQTPVAVAATMVAAAQTTAADAIAATDYSVN